MILEHLNKQNLTIITLIVLVVTAGLMTARQFQQAHTSTTPSPLSPSMIIENAIHTQMDAHGKPKLKLHVASIIQYRDNDAHFVQPHLTTLNQAQNWDVKSEYGKTSEMGGQDKLILKDNVIVKKFGIDDKISTIIQTPELTFWPDKNIAETDKAVTLEQGSGVIHAKGLYADMKLKQIELLSKVRGNYEKLEAKSPQ